MKDSTVVKVHFGSEHLRQKSKMADFLERIARYVRADALEIEPFGLVIVLKGKGGHEVLHVGIGTRANLREAALALNLHVDSAPAAQDQGEGNGC
jgi:hypothetical protein